MARGIYKDMPFAPKDYVIHFREDRQTWSVDRVGSGGTHTTIGSTRGYGTMEQVRKVIEHDAHVQNVPQAQVHDAGGELMGEIRSGRVYFYPGSWSRYPYKNRSSRSGVTREMVREAARRGAQETVHEAHRQKGGGYSLRQSNEHAHMYDAFFENRRIGSVRGPFASRDGKRTIYDWTLNGPRGQAFGRAKTQTAAFNQLIAKHKEWRATGADVSQVANTFEVISGDGRVIGHISASLIEQAEMDLARGKRGGWYPEDATLRGQGWSATTGSRVTREAHHSDDRPISMTYGELPPFEEFERDIRRPDPDHSDGRAYWPEGTMYPMELVNDDEQELDSNAHGFRGNEKQIYEFLEYLVGQWNNEGDEPAGDLASSIMTTLGYEWI